MLAATIWNNIEFGGEGVDVVHRFKVKYWLGLPAWKTQSVPHTCHLSKGGFEKPGLSFRGRGRVESSIERKNPFWNLWMRVRGGEAGQPSWFNRCSNIETGLLLNAKCCLIYSVNSKGKPWKNASYVALRTGQLISNTSVDFEMHRLGAATAQF